MYCPHCGSEIPDGSKYCLSCGASTVPGQAPVQPRATSSAPYNPYLYAQMKNTGIALLLAFFIPGTGHIYAGKLVKGLVILGIYYLLGATTFIAVFFVLGMSNYTMMVWPYQLSAELTAFMVVVSVILLILWIYQLFDAYTVTKKFNDELLATGHEPW